MRAATLQIVRTSRHRADSQRDDREALALNLRSRRRERQMSRTLCNALPAIGREEQKHAPPGGAANKDSADDGECLAPRFGRHTDLRESECRMVPGDCSRHGVEQPDRGADQRRADHREDDLPNRQGRAASEHADDERADHTGATVKGGEAHG
jgi:hypothetical protein